MVVFLEAQVRGLVSYSLQIPRRSRVERLEEEEEEEALSVCSPSVFVSSPACLFLWSN